MPKSDLSHLRLGPREVDPAAHITRGPGRPHAGRPARINLQVTEMARASLELFAERHGLSFAESFEEWAELPALVIQARPFLQAIEEQVGPLPAWLQKLRP